MAREYIRFDEVEDVLSSLDLLALISARITREPSYWKWVIVSSHMALQGAIVCVLAGTSSLPVLDKNSGRLMADWLDKRQGQIPDDRLADFGTLLDRAQDKQFTDGNPLALTAQRKKDILRLHRHFRNDFAHFTPKGWSIEVAGLPRIISAALGAIEVLMLRDRILYKLSGNKRRRLARNLAQTRAALGIKV